jgi:hypothetical protein
MIMLIRDPDLRVNLEKKAEMSLLNKSLLLLRLLNLFNWMLSEKKDSDSMSEDKSLKFKPKKITKDFLVEFPTQQDSLISISVLVKFLLSRLDKLFASETEESENSSKTTDSTFL